jgi:hypothetical protein
VPSLNGPVQAGAIWHLDLEKERGSRDPPPTVLDLGEEVLDQVVEQGRLLVESPWSARPSRAAATSTPAPTPSCATRSTPAPGPARTFAPCRESW